MSNRTLIVIAVAACSGVDGPRERIAIPSNELGAVAIQIDRSEEPEWLFELRGFDSHDTEVALVRHRIGTLDGLPADIGSEVVLSAGGEQFRTTSSEHRLRMITSADLPALQSFLELDIVTSLLEREGKIRVHPAATGATEQAYSTGTCPAEFMLSSPTARQCCFSTVESSGAQYTVHYNTEGNNAGKFGRRWKGPACRMSDGGSCSGDNCYYGPAGFARPDVFDGGPSPRVYSQYFWANGDYRCVWNGNSTQAIAFGDVTGTRPRGETCPGGGGGAGVYDY